MSITNYLNKIKTAVYGRDVRGAIHDAIKECYDDASVNHDNANMEVKMARGTHNTLNDRLDKSEQKLDETNAQLSEVETKTNYNSYNMFEKYIKHHKSLFSLPTLLEGLKDFPQGFAVNQEKDELYIARQLNGGTDVKISKYKLSTQELIETKQYEKSTGAYQEGLPYFYNEKNELCFLVRTTYDKTLAIFNFDTGELSDRISVLGGSKVASDIDNKYFVTGFGSANRFEGVYVYDFNSVINREPILLSTIHVSNIVSNGEKTQSIAIIDEKVILGQGAENPVITIFNLDGTILNSISYDRMSLANELSTVVSGIIPSNYAYENEGVTFYNYNGMILPLVAHVVNSSSIIFSLIGHESFPVITEKKAKANVLNAPMWVDVEYGEGVTSYGDDVNVQYCKDQNGFVHFRGVCTHEYTSLTPNRVLFKLPFPFYPSRNHFFSTVASGGSDRHNRIEVRNNGEVILVSTTSESERPFTVMDGISFSVL